MKRILLVCFSILALCSVSCSDGMDAGRDFSSHSLPVINGTKVADGEYTSVVSVAIQYNGEVDSICTGTLISPDYVLTAGHCVEDCDDTNDMEYYRKYMKIGIGNSEKSLKLYDVDTNNIHWHPNFVCNDYDIQNDIAIIKLKKSIPEDVAKPMLILPPAYLPKSRDFDNEKVIATSVGFGLTNPNNNNSSGVKYKTSWPVTAYCSLNGLSTGYCSYLINDYGLSNGFIYFVNDNTNLCNGDSGGPTFITRDGVDYVAGINSFVGKNCEMYAATTVVNDHRDFLKKYIADLPPETPEICDNGKDDNGDGKIDCKDVYCRHLTVCQTEICYNGVDDNANGTIDCDDPDCEGNIRCEPEICDNGKDDNDNGATDCNDAECKDAIVCQPEICDNGKDDNGNNLADCDDPDCSKILRCQPENCSNDKDDNGNNLIDCDDPQCGDTVYCQPEICDNGIDDNENGLIDCNDAACFYQPACNPENCSNHVDDNADTLVDCDDPQCSTFSDCQPQSLEICGNNIDDDRNGLIDCEDPACVTTSECGAAPGLNPSQTPDDTTPTPGATPTPTPTPTTPSQNPVQTPSQTPGQPSSPQTPSNSGDTLNYDCSDPYWQSFDFCRKKESAESCSAAPNSSPSGSAAAILAMFGILGCTAMRRRAYRR